MVSPGANTLINNEGGSDQPLEFWLREIPKAKSGGVKVLIASINGDNSMGGLVEIALKLEQAGADIIEFVDDYHNADNLVEKVKLLKGVLHIPMLVKVNGNWKNTAEEAKLCIEAGADGITAIDSIGPTYRVNLATGKPILGGKGYGYLTGSPILPIALRYVHDIAEKVDTFIVGTGGITKGSEALEMLLVGATACGVCTLPIIHGPSVFKKLNKELSDAMDKYGYKNIKETSRKTITAGLQDEVSLNKFQFDAEKCTHCNRCVTACTYGARRMTEMDSVVDAERCRICGLCFSVCSVKAITLK
jgi:dihydroorotate dehydrogenase (fumarate)